MEAIFTPIKINSLELKNRLFFPPMGTNFAQNGKPSARHLAYHRERAAAGCALNIIEATYLETVRHNYRMALDEDNLVSGLARLVDAIHEAGGKAGIQLQQQGRSASPETTGCVKRYVSLVPGLTGDEASLVMTVDDIKTVIERHVRAVARAIRAGVDLVELHGAHGFLIAQFLSPLTNRREDGYGGSFENRMRFAVELLEAVRQEAGSSYPITMRLSASEMRKGGLDLEDTRQIAKILVENGIDAISISAGIRESYEYAIPPAIIPEGWLVEKAGEIRDFIDAAVPVMVAGRILSLGMANRIIENKKADMVGMGRALLADPELIKKHQTGQEEKILPCLGCNARCIGQLEKGLPIGCAVNPRVGKEYLYPMPRPVGKRKKIKIIGAGVAGLMAANHLAEQGHDVEIHEKNAELGGLLNVAAIPPHKEPYRKLLDGLLANLADKKVRIHSGSSITAGNITGDAPDLVILATGSSPVIPSFCQGKEVLTAQEALNKKSLSENILILGGGSVGVETAEYLANGQNRITLVEMRDAFAPEMEWRWRKLTLAELERQGVNFLPHTRVLEISADRKVLLEDSRDEKSWWAGPFDHIIVALGYKPNPVTDLEESLRQNSIPFTVIGDAAHVGLVGTAAWQAFQASENA